MATEAEIAEACNFFTCGPSSKSTQQLLYYQGVLMCGLLSGASDSSESDVNALIITEDGDIPAGAKQIVIVPSSDFDGAINGVAMTAPFPNITINAPIGSTLPAIPVAVVTGSLTVFIIQ